MIWDEIDEKLKTKSRSWAITLIDIQICLQKDRKELSKHQHANIIKAASDFRQFHRRCLVWNELRNVYASEFDSNLLFAQSRTEIPAEIYNLCKQQPR